MHFCDALQIDEKRREKEENDRIGRINRLLVSVRGRRGGGEGRRCEGGGEGA